MKSKEFRQKVLPLSRSLYRFASGLLKNTHEAEDIVQDIFIKLWNMKERMEDIENLDNVLISIQGEIDLGNISKLSKSLNIEGMESLEKIDE